MKWRELNKIESEKEYQKYFENNEIKLLDDYIELRNALKQAYEDAKELAESTNKPKHLLDVYFGAKLYSILDKEKFSLFEASNDNIWRYISICIIPDIVKDRWGDNKPRFFAQKNRIWLRFIWFCIYLAWDGTLEKTIEVLEPLNTDVVVQYVERNDGGQGYRVELNRCIFKYLKMLHHNEVPSFRKISKRISINHDISRDVAKLNNFRCMVIEPSLYKGGIKGYVADLFETIRKKYES